MGSTIKDVARLAEVSIATVSRVLNKTSPVSDDKRRRVEKAVEYLGYSPNPAAVSLLKGETGGIGVLLPAVGGEFFAELLLGIDNAVQAHDYILMVSPSHRSVAELTGAITAIAQRVDGLIVMAPDLGSDVVAALVPAGLPVVYVNTLMEAAGAVGIGFDNYGGMRALTAHLLSAGHERIDFITGPHQGYDASQRLKGFTDACNEAGPGAVAVRTFAGDFTLGSGYKATCDILDTGQTPTAIVAANDLSAQGALRRLREVGIRVPQDIALAGFDDIPSARFMTPPLTTVHVPIREIGVSALNTLVDLIRNGSESAQAVTRMLPAELVIRESTTGFVTE